MKKIITAFCAVGALATLPAYATETSNIVTSPNISIAFHGFVDASYFYQDHRYSFGNGQNAEVPVSFGTPGRNQGLSGGDVRNTRAWFDIGGPMLDFGWRPDAHIEFDFFGGNNGTGAFSGQQPNPRLRLAYVQLTNPTLDGTLIFGQQWDLLFPAAGYDHLLNLPPSLTHIAFPTGLGTGLIGWRYPGVVYSQGLGALSPGLSSVRVDLGIFEGNFPQAAGDNTNNVTAGSVNFNPQYQARLSYSKGGVLAYVVGDYSSEHLTGVGGTATPAGPTDKISTYAVEAGAKVAMGPASAGLSAYIGRGVGANFGSLTQFGDIRSVGGYAWGEYKLAMAGLPHWAVGATYTIDKPNEGDVNAWISAAGQRNYRNQNVAADLMYENGPYGFGLEWMHSILKDSYKGGATEATVANQLSVSAIFHF